MFLTIDERNPISTSIHRPQMIHLTADDIVADKPFTHVSHTLTDADNLERLRHALAKLLLHLPSNARDCQQQLDYIEEDGRTMRHIVVRLHELLVASALTVVGFCGTKRAPLHLHEQEEMAAVDAELVNELCQHPHMLSYCSIETGDGNWHNLVLMSRDESIQHWRGSARHTWAVDSLAPRFYQHIRLHNGTLPAGLNSECIVFASTKYFDYESDPPWRATRHP